MGTVPTMDDEQTKFWGILIMVAVGVAAAVLLIDLTIKAAILEESNAFKRELLNARRNPAKADSNGADNHSVDNGSDDSDDVSLFPARVEAPSVRSRRARTATPKPMAGTIEYSERMGNNGVAPTDKPVDS
jgi:hypothetical protein